MQMRIEEDKPYLLKSEHLYRLGLAILGAVVIFTQWLFLDLTHILVLIMVVSLIFLYLLLDYLLARTAIKLTILRYTRVSLDSFTTGVFFALINFEYILVLIIGFGCVISLFLYKEKYLLLNALLLCLGAGITYWLLLPLTSRWDTFVANPITIVPALLLLGCYCMVLISRGLEKDTLMLKQLSSAAAENQALTNRVFQLSEYLSPAVRQAVLSGIQLEEEPEEKQITVFFSDIVGFTNLTEQLSPDELISFLNTYLAEMSKIAARFGGTIDKIMGDAIMVFFGDSETRGIENDAVSCVSMAVAMKKSMTELQLRWQRNGMVDVPSIRIGINSGLCRIGNFGSAYYLNYTLLGRSVNLASRLETAANAGEILISLSTYNLVKNRIHCVAKGEVDVSGFSQPLLAYSVVGLMPTARKRKADPAGLDPQGKSAT